MATAAEVGADIDATVQRVSKAVAAATKAGLRDVGKAAKKHLEASGRGPTGGDLALSNFRGPKMGVKAKVSDGSVTIVPTGAWGILEPGAQPHSIGARGRPMPIGGGRVRRGPFRHPGTRDTGAWSTGRDDVFREVDQTFPDEVTHAVEEAFGG